jgi:hypothetical protein
MSDDPSNVASAADSSGRHSRRPQLKIFIVDAESVAHRRNSTSDDGFLNPLNGNGKWGHRTTTTLSQTSSPAVSSLPSSPTTPCSGRSATTSSDVGDDDDDDDGHITEVVLEDHESHEVVVIPPLLLRNDYNLGPSPLTSFTSAATDHKGVGFRADLNEAEQRFRYTMDKQRDRTHAHHDASYGIRSASQQHGIVALKMLVVEAHKQTPRKVEREQLLELIRVIDDIFAQSHQDNSMFPYQEVMSLLATQQLFRQ